MTLPAALPAIPPHVMEILTLLTRIDGLEKSLDIGNYLGDVTILKSFHMPLNTELGDVFIGSPAHALLKDRPSRPSPELWNKYIEFLQKLGISEGEIADIAAGLYQIIRARLHPPLQSPIPHQVDAAQTGDMYPPNIVGDAIDGLGMSADGVADDDTISNSDKEHVCT